jgi:Flp pilus assembly protein TadD
MAQEAFDQGIALLQKLAEESPEDTACRRELAQSYNERGIFLERGGRLKEAEGAYRQALALTKGLGPPPRPSPRWSTCKAGSGATWPA